MSKVDQQRCGSIQEQEKLVHNVEKATQEPVLQKLQLEAYKQPHKVKSNLKKQKQEHKMLEA